MEERNQILAQGGLRDMQVLRDFLRRHGVEAEVLRPPGCDPKG